MTISGPPIKLEWIQDASKAGLGSTDFAVAVAMASYANGDGTNIYPGNELLAVGLGVAVKTVNRAMERLRSDGVLIRIQSGDRSGGKSDVYELGVLPPSVVPAWRETKRQSKKDSVSTDNQKSKKDSVSTQERHSVQAKGTQSPTITSSTTEVLLTPVVLGLSDKDQVYDVFEQARQMQRDELANPVPELHPVDLARRRSPNLRTATATALIDQADQASADGYYDRADRLWRAADAADVSASEADWQAAEEAAAAARAVLLADMPDFD